MLNTIFIEKSYIVSSILNAKSKHLRKEYITLEELNYISDCFQKKLNELNINAVILDKIDADYFDVSDVIKINKSKGLSLDSIINRYQGYLDLDILLLIWDEETILGYLSELKEIKTKNDNKKDFKIKLRNNSIIIQKNNQGFAITQSSDDDVWFSTSQDEMEVELCFSSRNYFEYQTYLIFEYLMKTIVGSYILNGDNKKEYSRLPKDFIDLDKKVIIWHSDDGINNVLKLEYTDIRNIKISISKCKDSKEHYTNSVRIRTSGSEYEYYYQEFLEFFRHLVALEKTINKQIDSIQQDNKEENKKLSLFKKKKK